jgi:pimeloyl-ACP methyl ester carboxylesterase
MMISCIKKRITLLLAFYLLAVSEIYAVEIAKQRLKVSNEQEYIPFISNFSIDTKNEKIKNVILAIHSSNYDAYLSYNDAMRLIKRYELPDSVLVISPQFLTEKHVADINSSNLVYWTTLPFWGSSIAKITPNGMEYRLSSYTILENIIVSLCEKKIFPNLQSIVVLGHSAGGQLVNRFAASNTVEDTAATPVGVKIKYVVMNPSSYVYFSPKRPVKNSRKLFTIPAADATYDDYGCGLKKLYAYHRNKGLTAEKIRQQYKNRNVIYMLGNQDTNSKALSITPAAMLQGENRLIRGLNYYNHLIDEFGQMIKKNQKLVIIPGVGHSARRMMLSSRGAANILGGFIDMPKNMNAKSYPDALLYSGEDENEEESN